MTTLKVAIATVDEMKEWTMRVVRGEERRKPGDPKLWFPSVESFLKTLSVGHRKLLREIVEKHVSVSLDELSRMTGRKKSDFRGMLDKLVPARKPPFFRLRSDAINLCWKSLPRNNEICQNLTRKFSRNDLDHCRSKQIWNKISPVAQIHVELRC